MFFRIGSVTLIAVLSISATLRAESLEETLLPKEHEFVEAIQKKDMAKLKEMLADDACTVVPGAGRQTGNLILERLASMDIQRYKINNVKAIAASKDVGILSFEFSWSGKSENARISTGTYLSTSTWAQRDGQWKMLFYQQTPWKE